ncbi:DegT/DnrJ/EryC1/StrS family aminotransferase [Algoriphagus hitonicola]|uniref:dTDP-4-amino-4,6-dideoxygalactose transaminase n=1 Tax=Algoriphagus hitonicola TaxID=435880 RepID=A0A1I2TH92_9BACT|nr:DegT/DnrJ/EryC1/StrS family aminotransferase [Algoriphagus hitonicola]SFG64290.1 dTDP-4-amino-4,6-dideoxygalactose transaminase [Algoriphagus hitonicola]
MAYQIKLSAPIFNGNESIYIQQAVDSGHLATYGSFIDQFEYKLGALTKTHQAVALNSGTSALHLGMALLGVSHGDEVICQSFTFCASANPIIYLGATPIFVDSELDTWNMCPELLEDAILNRIANGRKPKAIVIVHLFGMPAKMNEIIEVASKYQIPILEDAAEAVGSKYANRHCGTFGELGVYSFNGNKIITAGGGGALISKNASLLQKAEYLSMQAREDLPYYQHLEIGYNYRMNNLSAAVGVAQMEQLHQAVKRRREINQNYRQLLNNMPGIKFQDDSDLSESNYWLTTVLIDEKVMGFSNDQLRIKLMKNGIETRFLWKPLHMQPVYRGIQFFGGSIAKSLFHSGICLPSSSDLTFDDQSRIVQLIQDELAKSFK